MDRTSGNLEDALYKGLQSRSILHKKQELPIRKKLRMASTPGVLTEWPWKSLGNFKYLILVPWVIKSTHSFLFKDEKERDLSNFLILPLLLWRMLHNQIWITLSRYFCARGSNRILDKGLEFDQVDRERNWDDQILLNGLLLYIFGDIVPQASKLPMWRTDGVIMTILLHSSAVEFLYYWLHRALHYHFLYSRYHSHHHSSIVTEPITSVIHPFAEHIAYFTLFAIPLLTTVLTRTASVASIVGYTTYVDFMNNLGHCNFELIPKWLFSMLPPLKYFMYTPSFHSLHHTQFQTNYSLFMPLYDFIYSTMDKSWDSLYESSIKREKELPNVVFLVHLTTPESIYHLQLGFAGFASKPYVSKWYLWLMWPVTLLLSMMLNWNFGHTFVVESNHFKKLKLQTWAIPKCKTQYLRRKNSSINHLIEEAILNAEENKVEVFSLGLLNQSEELNLYGELYVHRHPELKVKVVDGSSLATAVVVNSIPKGTTEVLLRGKIDKVACAIAFALCQKGIQVSTLHEDEYGKLNKSLTDVSSASVLLLSSCCSQKIWLVGDGVTAEEQLKASKGTIFIPFSQFPLIELRNDCFYHHTPAMLIPKRFGNVHSCENWLPRNVMSAWRIAGVVHALEGWNEHECGIDITKTFNNMNKVWEAALRHGFQPLTM